VAPASPARVPPAAKAAPKKKAAPSKAAVPGVKKAIKKTTQPPRRVSKRK
jgi:hypothetical protein